MSAYSASAPVTESTTAASAKNAKWKCPNMNCKAYAGDSALRISGWSMIAATPQAPIAVNHTIITGPKRRPTAAVPRRCTANNAKMITAVIGTTQVVELRLDHLDALDRRQHRDRGGDHAVAEEQRGAEEAQGGQRDDGPAAPVAGALPGAPARTSLTG